MEPFKSDSNSAAKVDRTLLASSVPIDPSDSQKITKSDSVHSIKKDIIGTIPSDRDSLDPGKTMSSAADDRPPSRTQLRAARAAQRFVSWEPYKAAVSAQPDASTRLPNSLTEASKSPDQKIKYRIGSVTRKIPTRQQQRYSVGSEEAVVNPGSGESEVDSGNDKSKVDPNPVIPSCENATKPAADNNNSGHLQNYESSSAEIPLIIGSDSDNQNSSTVDGAAKTSQIEALDVSPQQTSDDMGIITAQVAAPMSTPTLLNSPVLNHVRSQSPTLSVTTNERDEEKLARKFEELRLAYERLSVDRDCLADQINVQTNVNNELKRLVVASMGEDLETELDCMTHNKAHLAQSIEHYVKQVSQGNENIEKLAIQSDIWRSKYLASSVMVDELVSWRLFLIGKFEEAQSCILNVTREQEACSPHLTHSLLLLKDIAKALEPAASSPTSRPTDASGTTATEQHCGRATYLDFISQLNDLSKRIHSKLLDDRKHPMPSLASLTEEQKQSATLWPTQSQQWARNLVNTDASKFYASSPCTEGLTTDERQARLMGISHNVNMRNVTVNCCNHCAGEIKLV